MLFDPGKKELGREILPVIACVSDSSPVQSITMTKFKVRREMFILDFRSGKICPIMMTKCGSRIRKSGDHTPSIQEAEEENTRWNKL